MNRQWFLCLSLVLGVATSTYAQFSAGLMAGIGYSSQKQVSSSPDYVKVIGVDAIRLLPMVGVYGQYVTKGKWGFVGGFQLRYQWLRQTTGLSSVPMGALQGDKQYNQYDYLVAAPYVGMRLFNKVEIAVGPEINFLVDSQLGSIPRDRNPVQRLTGYNVKATYWLDRLGLESGYSHQNTAFDSQQLTTVTTFSFYNSYVYAAVKYNLLRPVR